MSSQWSLFCLSRVMPCSAQKKMASLVFKQISHLILHLFREHIDKLDDHSEGCKESCRAISGSLFNLLWGNMKVTACVDSRSCTYHFMIVDTSQNLLCGDGENSNALCPAIFTYEACKPHKMAIYLLEVNPLKRHLSYVGEEGGGQVIFSILLTAKEGRVIYFTPDLLNYSVTSCQPNINRRHAMNYRGMMLDTLLVHDVTGSTSFRFILHFSGPEVPTKQLSAYIWRNDASSKFVESLPPGLLLAGRERKRRRRSMLWSSLPVLLLWMIKDRLNIFDNWRLAAVCRDWCSASACYPRTLQSVGDGVPWIWQSDFNSCSRVLISFLGKRKLVIEEPEFAKTSVMSSKQGWLLVSKRSISLFYSNSHMFLMNLFTRAKINLPDLDSCFGIYNGSFTISSDDGFPDRVVLLRSANMSTDVIQTARPGDQVWTSYTFSGLARNYVGSSHVISIGQRVYFQDELSNVRVFDMENQSYTELPRLKSGFIAEHRGELIYVESRLSERRRDPRKDPDIDYDCSSFAVYRYNDSAPTLWEKLEKSEVMDTSWFLCDSHSCIAAKGKGLKVYDLRQVLAPVKRHYCRSYVVAYDLSVGTAQVCPIPFQVQRKLKWVGIG